jgi:hypothetical protein
MTGGKRLRADQSAPCRTIATIVKARGAAPVRFSNGTAMAGIRERSATLIALFPGIHMISRRKATHSDSNVELLPSRLIEIGRIARTESKVRFQGALLHFDFVCTCAENVVSAAPSNPHRVERWLLFLTRRRTRILRGMPVKSREMSSRNKFSRALPGARPALEGAAAPPNGPGVT